MTLDDLKLTVARTSGPQLPNGTAFLVSPTHVLTCAHCVRNEAGVAAESVELYFSTWPDSRKQQGAVVAVDKERDVALLRLSSPVTVPACPRNSNAVNEARWLAFGYPKPTGRNGILFAGQVRDIDARTGESERRVIQLQCEEAEYALKGASGSPVCVNEAIVGMITSQAQTWGDLDADGTRQTRPAYGALFAVSMAQVASIPLIQDVVDVQPAMGMAAPPPAPTHADFFQQYRQIVEAMPKLLTVKVPGSSGTIETVPLESIYVEPALGGLRQIDEIWSRRRVAVVGEEGLGKGAFLKALNLRLLHAGDRGENALWPLYVELDRYAEQTEHADLLDFALDDLLGRRGDERLRAHLKRCGLEGLVVLLCDGLENIGLHYARVVEALSRQPRFIVGVRPGSRMDVGQEAGGTLRLQPFDRARIQAFIGKWADSIGRQTDSPDEGQLLNDIVGQPSLLEMARIPRFLGLICSVMSGGQTSVATRTALISSAWNTVWQAAFGRESFARRQGAARTLQQMARAIFERGASVRREFGEDELYQALDGAGEGEPDAVVARLVEHEIIAPGRDSGYASRSFRFPLDGFAEYLAAEGLANDDAFLKALPSLRIDRRWTQMLPLVTGVIARTRNRLPVLRDFLSNLSALSTGESIGLHACLVAECLAEVPAEVLLQNVAPLAEKATDALLNVFVDYPMTLGRMMPAIRRLQSPALRHGFERILEDRSRPLDLRSSAAYALSAFADQKAFETLARITVHGDVPAVRTAACLGLASSGRGGVGDVLVAALRDPEMVVRIMAARCLGRRRDRGLASMVISAWLDSLRRLSEDELLRAVEANTWMAAIVSLRPEATIPVLLQQLAEGGGNNSQLAAQVFAETGTRAAAWPGILVLASAENDALRQDVAQMLFRLGTAAAIAALRRAIASGDQAAKIGVHFGHATTQILRLNPASDLLIDPVEASLTASIVAPIETEIVEAQAAAMRAPLMVTVAREGREAVLARARETFAQAESRPNLAAPQGDMLTQLAKFLSGGEEDKERAERVAAFETIQLLEGDPDSELLVNGLFDADSTVAMGAVAWIRRRQSSISIERLLDRMDATPSDPTNLCQAAAVGALSHIQHLRTLVERYRRESRAAAQALWLLSAQFGFNLYEDGRIELPDGQIETDYEKVAQRLHELDAAAARESSTAVSDEALAFKDAEAEFLEAEKTRPLDGAGWASRARVEMFFSQYRQGCESIESAIQAEPTTAPWFRFRGLLCHGGNVSVETASDFERAIALGDHSTLNYVDAGDALLACGEFERAATRFSQALKATPDQPDALLGRARARFELSQFEDAVGDLDALLAKVTNYGDAVRLRARANARLGRAEATQADLNAADAAEAGGLLLPAHPELWEPYLAQARQLLAAGKLDEAHTAAKRVIIANPLHPVARVLRARVWIEKGAPEFAITDLVDLAGRLTEAGPRDALAVALDELAENNADEHLQPLTLIQRANNIGIRGVVLAALGARDRALSDLEQAVAAGASEWKMLDTLAGFYIDVEGKLDEGLRLAGEALQAVDRAMLPSDAEKAAVRFTFGRANFKKGFRDQARKALEEAAVLAPDDAAIAALLNQVTRSGD
jgi:tetratricopeptide (TPR) repeat protein/HEAT repeat protein